MEKAKLEIAVDNRTEETLENEKGVRLLNDSELLLIGGGGDENPNW
jgi:hypothetical protein